MCRERLEAAGFNTGFVTLAAIAAVSLLFYAALMPETRGLKKAPQVGQV